MNVLVACEVSGKVRDAFIARGHNAISADLKPSLRPGPHYQGDVRALLDTRWSSLNRLGMRWDLVIAFPPCDHLAVSGARWFAEKRADGRQQAGIDFFLLFTLLEDIPMVAIENPIGIMSRLYRKPDQIIQPWQYGHGETKATCLWLKGLPKLQPTNTVAGREPRVHYMSPSADRGMLRGLTYDGIAQAMAQQWGTRAASHHCA